MNIAGVERIWVADQPQLFGHAAAAAARTAALLKRVLALELVEIQHLAEVTLNPFLREAVFLQRVFVLALEFLLALRGFVKSLAQVVVQRHEHREVERFALPQQNSTFLLK